VLLFEKKVALLKLREGFNVRGSFLPHRDVELMHCSKHSMLIDDSLRESGSCERQAGILLQIQSTLPSDIHASDGEQHRICSPMRDCSAADILARVAQQVWRIYVWRSALLTFESPCM
jgi:hypothetical protein